MCLGNDLADGDIDIGFNGPSILSYEHDGLAGEQNGMVGWGNLRRKFGNLGLALGFIN